LTVPTGRRRECVPRNVSNQNLGSAGPLVETRWQSARRSMLNRLVLRAPNPDSGRKRVHPHANAAAVAALVALSVLPAVTAMPNDSRAESQFPSSGTCVPPYCYRSVPARPLDNNASGSPDFTPDNAGSGGWQPSWPAAPSGYSQGTQQRSPGDGSHVPPRHRPGPDRPDKHRWSVRPDVTPYNGEGRQRPFNEHPPSGPYGHSKWMHRDYPKDRNYLPPRSAPDLPYDHQWGVRPNASPSGGWRPSPLTPPTGYPQGMQRR
jgi:hypothetical protein